MNVFFLICTTSLKLDTSINAGMSMISIGKKVIFIDTETYIIPGWSFITSSMLIIFIFCCHVTNNNFYYALLNMLVPFFILLRFCDCGKF